MVAPNIDPNPLAAPRVRLNPYIGPRPFKQKHRAYFFGRDEEARCLLARLIARGLLIFYAPSGAGKSSLINARLIPDLRERGYDVLPVARVGHQLPSGIAKTDVQNIFVFNLLRSLAKDSKLETLMHLELKQYLAQRPSAQQEEGEDACRVLIIDQLEELFTRHPEQWERRTDFFRQLREALEADRSLLVLLALREDFVAGLDRYAPIFPNGLSDRFRMERLLHDEAIEAVVKPTEEWIRGHNLQLGQDAPPTPSQVIFPPISEYCPNEAAELLVQNLRQIRASTQSDVEHYEFVEAVQLQVVCQRLWEKLKDEMPRPITTEDIRKHAKVEVALEEFYEQILADVLTKYPTQTEERLRNWFSGKLITANGFRTQVNLETDKDGGRVVGELPLDVVTSFVKKSLVRYEDVRGGRWYELSHDRLITPILKSNREWMEDESNSPLLRAVNKWRAERERLRMRDQLRSPRLYQYSTSLLKRQAKQQKNWFQGFVSKYWRWKLGNYLLAGQQLTEAEEWTRTHPGLMTEVVQEFIRESNQAEVARMRQQRSWLVGLLAGIVLLAMVCTYALVKRSDAMWEANLASSREFSAYAQSLLTVAPERTLLLALEAMQKSPSAEAQRVLSQSVLAARLKTAFRQDLTPRKVVLSPEGNRLAVINEQKTVRLLDAISGAELSRHQFSASLLDVSFSPDGQRLALAGDDDLVRIVMAAELKQEVAQFTHHGVEAVAFSPDSRWLVTGGQDQAARIWDISLKKPVREFSLHLGEVNAVAFSPDGQQLATACADGYARVWGVSSGALIRQLDHTRNTARDDPTRATTNVYDVCFSPNGKYLATGGNDGLAQVWELASTSTKPRYRFSHGDEVCAVAFSPTDVIQPGTPRLATASRTGTVKVWSVEQGQELVSFTAHLGAINSLVFSPDGKQLLTSGNDLYLKFWDAVARHGTGIEAVAYNAVGTRLATLDKDGRVIMWETLTNQPLFDFNASPAMEKLASDPNGSNQIFIGTDSGARFAPRMKTLAFHGNTLVVAGSEGIVVYNANFGNKVLEQPVPALTAMALSPQRDLQPKLRQVVTADARGELSSWELWSNQPSAAHQYLDPTVAANPLSGHAHEKSINDLAFSPKQGQWLASASDDKTVKIWGEAKTLQVTLRHDSAVTAVAFSDNGQYVAAASAASGDSGSSVVLWDWQAKKQLWAALHPAAIHDVIFRPDDNCVMTAGADGIIRVWDFKSGAKKDQFPAHEGSANAIAFSSDSQIFATVGEDKELQIHYRQPSAPALLTLARQRLVADWLEDDCSTYLHMPCKDAATAKGLQAFLRGKELAGQNLEAQATEQFRSAQSLYPVLQSDSQSEAQHWQREGQLARQLNQTYFEGTQKNIEDLATLFRAKGDGENGQDRLVLLGERLVRKGKVQNALLAYDTAKKLAPDRPLSAAHLNNLCWYGSLWSYALPPFDARLLQAGEDAVQLEPNNVNFLDSRGLARALSGKHEGAIADFMAYLTYLESRQLTSENKQQMAQRRRWLAQLRQHKAQAFTVVRPEIPRDIEQLRHE